MTEEKWHCFRRVWVAILDLGVLAALAVSIPTQSIGQSTLDKTSGSGRKPPEWSYNSGYDPGHQKPISSEGHDLLLTLTKSEGCPRRPPEWRCFTFQVRNREGRVVSEFKLDNDTGQVDEAHIVSESRAVVIGRGGQSIVSVVDLKTQKVIDSFYCFYPSVSPDGQFVAYNEWFPLHPDPYHPSSVYYIYDLTKAPDENRMKPEPNQKGNPNPFDAGCPVYPKGSGRKPASNLVEDPTLAHSMVSRGMFWLDHEHIFTFVDQCSGINKIVMVDVTQGIREMRLSERAVDRNDVIDPAKAEKCAKSSETSFYVVDMYVPEDRPGMLDIQFDSFVPICLRRSTLEVSLRPLK